MIAARPRRQAATLILMVTVIRGFFLHCRDRKCRRLLRCVGADLRCLREGTPPISRNDKKRLKRDFRRAPTEC